MRKQKKAENKLSLKKLQVAKINTGLNSIKGGSNVNTGNGTDTVFDKTKIETVLTVNP